MAAAVAPRRALMALYSRPECPQSHRVRFVLAEKGVTNLNSIEVRPGETNEDLLDLNPYHSLPTLVDRDLVLYDPRVIGEYLDERFPHPPLMPIDPVTRARYRMAIYRLEHDLYDLADQISYGAPAEERKARSALREILSTLAAEFTGRPFMGEEFSLADCTLAPILWRLGHYRITLPEKQGRKLADYGNRLFKRPGFAASLTALETEMA